MFCRWISTFLSHNESVNLPKSICSGPNEIQSQLNQKEFLSSELQKLFSNNRGQYTFCNGNTPKRIAEIPIGSNANSPILKLMPEPEVELMELPHVVPDSPVPRSPVLSPPLSPFMGGFLKELDAPETKSEAAKEKNYALYNDLDCMCITCIDLFFDL
eukprot:TRINITY_DN12965_c0_g4_i1.p2 TRINITY_DN12965_c0_g4~~TRINITY_DN12965_c0_g4_i1.p2  ORF type:complete len:158 (-),score=19.51 TRINITY_DN12965_c0_g4_i1:68-541(-)